MKFWVKGSTKTRQKAAVVVFFTTLLTLVLTPIIIANSTNPTLPTAEEVSSAQARLAEIEAMPNGTGVTLDAELAAEIAETKDLLNAAQTAITAEESATAGLEAAETALALAESLVFDEATYDVAIDSAEGALQGLLATAQQASDARDANAVKIASCIQKFLGVCTKTDGTYTLAEVLAATAANAIADTDLTGVIASAQGALDDARANKQKAIDDFNGLKQSAVDLAQSNLDSANVALITASDNKNQALAAAAPAVAKVTDDSLYDRVNQAVYNGQLITLTPATPGYEYLSQTATRDNQADVEFSEPFSSDEYTSRAIKLNLDDRAQLASVHFNATGLTEGIYNFIVNYTVDGIPYDVTYQAVVPSLLDQEYSYQLARLQAADLGDLAAVYEALWQGNTSVADAVKQIYPSQASTINDILSTLRATKDLPFVGQIATAALGSLEAKLTHEQIINGFAVNLGAGQSLAVGTMPQIVDAAISGAGLNPDDITQAINDTVEAGRLLADLAAAVSDLAGYLQNTNYNQLTGVQAINSYISSVASKYDAVNSALQAIATARANGNQVLGNNSYLKSIDELMAEVGVDFGEAVTGANQLLQRIADLSNSIANQAQGIGVDTLPDLKNYAVDQIEKAQQKLANWVADNRDPIAAAIKQKAVQIVTNQLDQLKGLVQGSQTYADLLDLVTEAKNLAKTVEEIIQTALGDYQVVEGFVSAAIEFARYVSGDFKNQLQNANSPEVVAELLRQLADRYADLETELANLPSLSDGAKTIANWAFGLADDVLRAAQPHLERALARLVEIQAQLTPDKFFEFSGGDSLSLSVGDPKLTVEANYTQDFLDVVDRVNQILARLGGDRVDLPEIQLPQLTLTPKNLSPLLEYNYPTLGTTVVFAHLTDDIVLNNQAFELNIAPPRLAEALERVGVKLGAKTYQVEILMPRCQIDGKSNLNAYHADCKADDDTGGNNNGGGGTGNNGGSGGGSVPDGLAAGNLSPTIVYRGLTADADSTPTTNPTAEPHTPTATEPKGEFVSIPIKRSNWALLSVALTLLVLAVTVVKLIGLRDHFTDKSNSIFRILTLVPTTAAIIVLIMLNDFDTPMALVNLNTLPVAGILIIQVALAIKSPHSDED
jgi:hypothetical protein